MAVAMKHMASSFAKLKKFKGDEGENPTVKQVRRRAKWDNDDYVCRDLILNGMSDSLFDIYQNVETFKDLWDTLKAKYMAEDASSKKFFVSNFTNFKMNDSRPVLEQYNELLGILGKFTQHKMNMDESIRDDDIARWVDSGAAVNVCKDRCWFKTYESLNDGSILHMRNESTALVHGRSYVDLSDLCDLHATPSLGNKKYFVTFIDDASRFYVIEHNDSVAINSIIESMNAIFDEHRFSSVPRSSQRSLKDGTKNSGGSVVSERVTEEVVQQPESKLRKSKRHRTPKDFVPEFQLYLIEGTRDEIYDQHSYCFNVEDDLKIFDEAMKSQDTSGLHMYLQKKVKVARKSTIRQLIARASIHNLIIHQTDVKTAFLNRELEEEAPKQWHQKFNEVVLSNGYLHNQANKCVYSKFDGSGKGVIICLYVDDMLIFRTVQVHVDLTKEFLSSRFSMKDIEEADVIFGIRIKHESNVSTPMDTCEELMPNKGPIVSQLEYSRVIGCLMYAMTYTRPDIAFDVGKLSGHTSNPVLEGYIDASWIRNTEDSSSISGWVFLLGGGAISWASKKQSCITGSTMEYEFMALAAADREAEWLKNLFFEIPLWVKSIAPIFIRCDNAATLAKTYS
nr:hypothetical protein [Tanacetum cinerariifolium]